MPPGGELMHKYYTFVVFPYSKFEPCYPYGEDYELEEQDEDCKCFFIEQKRIDFNGPPDHNGATVSI